MNSYRCALGHNFADSREWCYVAYWNQRIKGGPLCPNCRELLKLKPLKA